MGKCQVIWLEESIKQAKFQSKKYGEGLTMLELEACKIDSPGGKQFEIGIW